MKKIIALFFFLVAPVTSFASSWNIFWTVNSNSSVYFFDADSIQREPGQVMIWIKGVRKELPDADGAWATAIRYRIDCKKKTYQALSVSDYNSSNEFIKSYPKIGPVTTPAPDSVGEGIINVVCQNSFPNDKSKNSDYSKIEDNDIFAATKRLVRFQKDNADKAPI